MSSARVPPRRLARIVRAVELRADARPTPRGALRPVDFSGDWPATLRAAVALAPEFPPRAWAAALAWEWCVAADGIDPMAARVATRPEALRDLAAVLAKYDRAAGRLPPRARRRVCVTLDALSRGCDAKVRAESAAA